MNVKSIGGVSKKVFGLCVTFSTIAIASTTTCIKIFFFAYFENLKLKNGNLDNRQKDILHLANKKMFLVN